MFLTRRVHLVHPGPTIFNMVDRESQAVAAALCEKAAIELLARFVLAIFDVWVRSEVKALLRADQEVTVTLKEVQARREAGHPAGTFASGQSRVHGRHGTASRTLGELLRTTKHATEPEADRIQSTPPRSGGWCDCCWLHCRFILRPDVRTPHAVLRFNSYRGGLAFLGERSFGHEFQERGCCVSSSMWIGFSWSI